MDIFRRGFDCPDSRAQSVRGGNLVSADVDADDPAGVSDRSGKARQQRATPAPNLEDPLSGLQCNRIQYGQAPPMKV
jgi:hypothetical protein